MVLGLWHLFCSHGGRGDSRDGERGQKKEMKSHVGRRVILVVFQEGEILNEKPGIDIDGAIEHILEESLYLLVGGDRPYELPSGGQRPAPFPGPSAHLATKQI